MEKKINQNSTELDPLTKDFFNLSENQIEAKDYKKEKNSTQLYSMDN